MLSYALIKGVRSETAEVWSDESLWEEFFGELGQRNLAKQEGATAREEHPVLQCQHTYGSRKPEKNSKI